MKRELDLSWEAIPESAGYELEFERADTSSGGRTTRIFSKGNDWHGTIKSGRYRFHIRSLDDRRTPGPWSEWNDVIVKLPAVTKLGPANESTLGAGTPRATLKWVRVPGIQTYRVELRRENGDVFKTEEVTADHLEVDLPDEASALQWSVWSVGASRELEEGFANPWKLSVKGEPIARPRIVPLDSAFDNEVTWRAPKWAKSYSYVLSRKNSAGQWVEVSRGTDLQETRLNLDPKAPGGTHRLEVRARAPLHDDSPVAKLEFQLHEGERTEEAKEIFLLSKSIERGFDHFFFASYILASLDYADTNHELGTNLNFKSMGGSGRLGFGYMPKGRWGLLTFGEFSGLTINGHAHTYGAFEVDAVWRRFIGARSQARLFSGFRAFQVPEAKGPSETQVEVNNVSQLGPTVALQFLYSLTYKLGAMASFQATYGMLKLATPNDGELAPALSYQLSTMGTYCLTRAVTGAAGVAYKVDRASYRATPYSGGSELNYAREGDVNQATLSGMYLNLYLEWGY